MRSFRTAALLALPLAMASMLAAPAHADVKDGVDAWQAGNYQAAVAEWRPLALAGDADAQFNLGQAYKLGRGVPADLAQAEAWYRRAAKQGHLQAEDNLGLVLFTANRRQEAMPFIINSAARGEPRAQYVLGTAHFNGDLAAEDWPRAYALTKRASDAGLDIASARLAQLDSLIPLDQRRRGLAMIPEIERSEQQARLAAVNAAAPPAPKPAPASPVKVASLPASTPGTSYTPPPVIGTPAPAAVRPSAVPEPIRSVAVPSSPVASAAAAAAAEATANAVAATGQAGTTPGTTYAAPPESGKLPPKPEPAKPAAAKPAAEKPAPAKAAPVATAAATPAPVRVHSGTASPWRAQLGAFGVEANARNLWASLEKKNPAFAGRTPYLVKSGKLTRLQAGGFANKGEAESFCAAASKGGQACMVVDK
ncbi:cell division septation protein DedD [Sphingopyxis sp. OAS728]|uniref:SPOR domain-containing protein n=1 Tax=Sphingopyxis sp. OAS728 TaxID=2663823 RepID=UPI0019E469A3|nr:SPOR domain-containing protein [Sphingopyxis sp. OAS728]MBE1526549.1 cell division septation protein DedD [Sphingopyxis sp. OAS728]